MIISKKGFVDTILVKPRFFQVHNLKESVSFVLKENNEIIIFDDKKLKDFKPNDKTAVIFDDKKLKVFKNNDQYDDRGNFIGGENQ